MNDEIAIACIKNNVHKWEIAAKLGITDTHFSRKLRLKLTKEEKEKIFKIIEDIRKEKEQNGRNV